MRFFMPAKKSQSFYILVPGQYQQAIGFNSLLISIGSLYPLTLGHGTIIGFTQVPGTLGIALYESLQLPIVVKRMDTGRTETLSLKKYDSTWKLYTHYSTVNDFFTSTDVGKTIKLKITLP